MRQEVLIGVERRRRWSVDQKREIVGEVGVGGATVAAVARRHEISRQHIYQWRREMRLKGWASTEPAHFLPVELSPDPPEGAGCGGFRSNAGSVEIGLRNGRVVRVAADLPETQLMRLIRIAESA